jgi:hypothetical protein
MVEPFSMAILVGCLYFLPSIIAGLKRKKSIVSILIMNIFLGWTIVGWIVAFIWAMVGSRSKSVTDWDGL